MSCHIILIVIHDHKNVPIDSKALLRPGKRCAFRASICRSVLEISDVWVEVIISPFGMRMGSVMTASCLFLRG